MRALKLANGSRFCRRDIVKMIEPGIEEGCRHDSRPHQN